MLVMFNSVILPIVMFGTILTILLNALYRHKNQISSLEKKVSSLEEEISKLKNK